MREKRRKAREPKYNWSALIKAQAASGQKASSYCREHGINYDLFRYYRKKQLAADVEAEPTRELALSSSRFIPMNIPQSSSIRLAVGKGIVLESDQLPDVGWLVELITKLPSAGAISC